MKPRSLLVLFTVLASPLAVVGQTEPEPGALANMTLALSRSATDFVSETSTGYVTKLVKVSYGNKDLLQELLEAGFLGEVETSIKGWRIVAVDFTALQSSEEHNFAFYAVKTGRDPVFIPFSRLQIDIESSVSAEGATVKQNGESQTAKTSFKRVTEFGGQQLFEGSETEDPYNFSYELVGMISGSAQTAVRTLKVDGVSHTYTFDLINKLSIKPAVGVVTDNLNDGQRTPIEGSVSFSAFKAADVSAYPLDL